MDIIFACHIPTSPGSEKIKLLHYYQLLEFNLKKTNLKNLSKHKARCAIIKSGFGRTYSL